MITNPFDPGYFESEELRALGFGAVGDNVRISRDCRIFGSFANITIGHDVRIDAGTHIIATGSVALGSFIHIGGLCHLNAAGGLAMADFSGLSQGVRIYTASDDYTGRHLTNPTIAAEFTGVKIATVTLGRHAIIGSGSVILPGCSVGDGAAVGALSLVNKSVPDWELHSGQPARKLMARSQRLLELERKFLESRG